MKKRMKVIISVVLAVVLVAAMSITAFAVSGTDDGSLGTAMKNMMGGFRGHMSQLTDEQKAQMRSDMVANMKTKLDELVAAGTITQDQADAAYKIISESTGKIDFSALPAEVAAALKSSMRKGEGRGMMDQLTAEQQTAVKSVMDESVKTALAELVAAGTITQEQADAITAQPGNRAAVSNLTEEQRAAVKSAIDAARKSGLAKLVENGMLTQEQADRMGRGGPGGPGGPGGKGGRGGCGGGMGGGRMMQPGAAPSISGGTAAPTSL